MHAAYISYAEIYSLPVYMSEAKFCVFDAKRSVLIVCLYVYDILVLEQFEHSYLMQFFLRVIIIIIPADRRPLLAIALPQGSPNSSAPGPAPSASIHIFGVFK